jgi:hypothetical protein
MMSDELSQLMRYCRQIGWCQMKELCKMIGVVRCSAEGEMLGNEVRVVPADWVKPAEGVVPADEVVSVHGWDGARRMAGDV